MFAQGLCQKDVSGFPLFGMGPALLKNDTTISKRSLGPLFTKDYFTKELFILYDLSKLYSQIKIVFAEVFSFRKRCNMLLNIPAWVLASLIHSAEGKLASSATIHFVFTGCSFAASKDTQLIR